MLLTRLDKTYKSTGTTGVIRGDIKSVPNLQQIHTKIKSFALQPSALLCKLNIPLILCTLNAVPSI